jgi:hypothetical protein
MLQNMKLVVDDAAPTAAGLAGTAPTCPHKPLESHFVETHSDASRKTHPASLSFAPLRTTTVLPFPGWSLPSETSASSPGKSRPLSSATTPVDVAPEPSAVDIASRSLAPCSRPGQTAGPLVVPQRSRRLALLLVSVEAVLQGPSSSPRSPIQLRCAADELSSRKQFSVLRKPPASVVHRDRGRGSRCVPHRWRRLR